MALDTVTLQDASPHPASFRLSTAATMHRQPKSVHTLGSGEALEDLLKRRCRHRRATPSPSSSGHVAASKEFMLCLMQGVQLNAPRSEGDANKLLPKPPLPGLLSMVSNVSACAAIWVSLAGQAEKIGFRK